MSFQQEIGTVCRKKPTSMTASMAFGTSMGGMRADRRPGSTPKTGMAVMS